MTVGGTAADGGAEAKGKMQKAEVLPSTFFIHPFSLVGLERSTGLFRDPSNAGRRFTPLLLADAHRHEEPVANCDLESA